MYAAATMSLGAVLLMLIATGTMPMVSGQSSMSIVDYPQYSYYYPHFSVFRMLPRQLSELIKHQYQL